MPGSLARVLWIAAALVPASLMAGAPARAQSMDAISAFILSNNFSNPMPYQKAPSQTPEQQKQARDAKQAASNTAAAPTGRVGTATASPAHMVQPVRYEERGPRPR